jgi:hypothetical protein
VKKQQKNSRINRTTPKLGLANYMIISETKIPLLYIYFKHINI